MFLTYFHPSLSSPPSFVLSHSVYTTEYTERWPCPLFDILLNKYVPANDIYRFPRLLTTFSSGSRFEFPMALVTKAGQERKMSTELYSFNVRNLFLVSRRIYVSISDISGWRSYSYSVTENVTSSFL